MCLQCALRALVANQTPETFDETPEAHLARVHPDAEACQQERRDLLKILEARRLRHEVN
jgi:hypothetical protein